MGVNGDRVRKLAASALEGLTLGRRQKIYEGWITRRACKLALSMGRLHGGRWIAKVDHDAGFILIRPRLGASPPQ